MAEGLNPQQVQYMVAAMQNPQAAMQLQQQSQLAQQMMQQGAEQPNPNETINEGIGGAHTVPFNKWGGLARMGEQMTGAYLQNQNNQKLGAMLQAANGQQGDGSQSASNGMGNSAAPLTGDMMKDYAFSQLNPEGYKQALQLKQAAALKAAEQSQTPVNMNGHMTFMTPPALQNAPQPNAAPVQGNSAPSANAGGNGQPSAPVNLTTNGQPNIDYNDRASVKQREDMIEGDVKYLNDTLLPAKDAAVSANNSLSSLQSAAAIANSNDLTHTGPTAPARLAFFKNVNDFLSTTGGQPFDQNEIAGADTINKVGVRLSAAMTKQLGSREAAQIFDKIQSANPNWAMQPQTLNLVSNLIGADNNTTIGRYNAGYASASKGGMAQDGVNAYDAQSPGLKNIQGAFTKSGMTAFSNPNDPSLAQLPKGSKFYILDPNSPLYGQQRTKN